MFQTFEVTARPEQGPPRLAALRAEMAADGLDGYLVPRADAHQGEYVAARDARLSWLTGFTGSAGFCVVLEGKAGVFVDGRYRTQVKAQVADVYTPVPWPEVTLAGWLKEQLRRGSRVGFDPWLHSVAQLRDARLALEGTGIALVAHDNLVDRIWEDQPGPPMAPARAHPLEFAGESAADKRRRLAAQLAEAGQKGAVLTLPDSIMWLLNIRGSDIERNPVAQCFAVLYDTGAVDLFITPAKVADLADHLGSDITVWPPDAMIDALEVMDGPIRFDPASAPQAVAEALGSRGVEGPDPCLLPKACKNAAEIAGSEQAHLRDAAAVVECLAWLNAQAPGTVTEIDVVRKLEACRRQDNSLQDISFETISGTGPNGAIMHYRVTDETDATLEAGHLLVLDSGGQYLDGTTDITRTIAVGEVGTEEKAAFTRVLQGMIGMSRLRWPRGLAGRDIEAVGRMPLWRAGQDFNHGLGHGVGAYLSVHEGPQRLSRTSDVALQPGMILSNEPGYYREGAFGIRIENLLVVQEAKPLPGGDAERSMYDWRTLTWVPIDRRCILADRLSAEERDWLDRYHAEVFKKIGPRVDADVRAWLERACAPL
ncbi:aminopeptidase P family protein [Marinibacterium profundimaris]|uniref:X-Pro aminopeptidase n=1 Tax=Marinibacterium profundimaris TaxID=1679460 RepID=A0A225NSS3_9RHOB|nr:aminopeptidase P family protein [Marinibacterium profundimaris]OWU77961.1 X-Pro aminopeptidase [Marinibacterium profundimaris]